MKSVFCARRSRGLRFAAVPLALGVLSTAAFGQVDVLTQHYNNARTGNNTGETLLTPANLNATNFGKLFTITLDANVNSQVLYKANLTINGTGNASVDGTKHNVLFAYTSNNRNASPCSLWAVDADNGATLWQTTQPNSSRWMTSTPVIDAANNLLYVVTKSPDDNGATMFRAFDIVSGKEKSGSPLMIDDSTTNSFVSIPGTGDGNVNGTVFFDTTHANCRPALLLVNGIAYAGFSHNTDSFPYHGWILGFTYDPAQSKVVLTASFCVNPTGGDDGVWQAGKGLMADDAGNMYFTTGNGTFDADVKGISSSTNYGMAVVKMSTPDLTVLDWFAPHDQLSRSNADLDVGNVGPLIIPNTNRIFTGGTKFGSSFLLDMTNLGHYNATTDQAVQRIDNFSSTVGQNPVVWEASDTIKYVYLFGPGNNILQWKYDTALGTFTTSTAPFQQGSVGTTGGNLVVTSNGQNNGVLWALGNNHIVYALDATDISKPALWTSTTNATRDSIPSVGKWQFPMVVNGKAYIPTGAGSVAVYGLLPVGLSGTLAFDGISPTALTQPVTFQLRPTDGSATITTTANVGPDGAFSLTNVPANKYTLWVKSFTYLAAATPIDTTNGSLTGVSLTLEPGDADNSNAVDLGDFSILVNAFGSMSGDPKYDVHADFNGDGFNDIGDFGLLVGTFGTAGVP